MTLLTAAKTTTPETAALALCGPDPFVVAPDLFICLKGASAVCTLVLRLMRNSLECCVVRLSWRVLCTGGLVGWLEVLMRVVRCLLELCWPTEGGVVGRVAVAGILRFRVYLWLLGGGGGAWLREAYV